MRTKIAIGMGGIDTIEISCDCGYYLDGYNFYRGDSGSYDRNLEHGEAELRERFPEGCPDCGASL